MNSVMNSGEAGWVLEYGPQDDARATPLLWASQLVEDPESASVMEKVSISYEGNYMDVSCSKKRNRTESHAEPGTKACREKMRRDRLNDRFYELCSLLDPVNASKADKVAILADASRRLNQLRDEAQKLKETNAALEEEIKKLKADKSELRDEKISLKGQKERMEQILKAMSLPAPFMTHAAVPATYHPAAFPAYNKDSAWPNYPPVTMWQWLPHSVVDTSQDHVLRPPVA